MLTKYVITIGGKDHELSPEDLKNWGQINCTYKRDDFGGVIRSFMSKFEFVNEGYRLLMDEYDSQGYKASARVTMFVMNDRWEFEPEFGCELDFSSLQYDDYVLSISAIDQSVSSVIKANKGTKFEFTLGSDITVNAKDFLFERLDMTETATYEITDGTSQDDGSLIGTYNPANGGRIMLGSVGRELCIGGTIHLNDDQEYGNGYLFKALKDTTVKVDYTIDVSRYHGCAPLVLMKNDEAVCTLHNSVGQNKPFMFGDLDDIDEALQVVRSFPDNQWDYNVFNGYWVTVKGVVWEVQWIDTPLFGHPDGYNEWVNTGMSKRQYLADVKSGSLSMAVSADDIVWVKFDATRTYDFSINSSSIKFSWTSRGAATPINCITPIELLGRILSKMGVTIDCRISDYDSRVKNTVLLSAESIRNITNAKITASFSDFCTWMETVFGYVYVINEKDGIVEFKHRLEIFDPNAPIVDILNIRDTEYTINKSVLYSSVAIGYSKREYEGVNGREEFNMGISYTTDYTNDGKKFELKSPFRADSYGIEFLAEKRGEDSTDNSSDKDVFFVSAYVDGSYLRYDYTPNMQGANVGSLLNGEFTPVHCLNANKDVIAIMANSLRLDFASADGNTNIKIGHNTKMSDSVLLDNCQMLTPGELKFSSDTPTLPGDANSLFRVYANNCEYLGYLKEVSFKYGKPEKADYKLMIKHKRPCI